VNAPSSRRTVERPDLAGVAAEFDSAAPHYDLLVGLNPGYHAHLRLSARRLCLPGDGRVARAGGGSRRLRLLDLGCGTGLSTTALHRVYPHAEIVGVDASAGMVAAARRKRWPSHVRFVHARAEDLTAALAGDDVRRGFDAVLAAYLLRNVTDRDGVLDAVRDLLLPGGRLALHEYSVADSGWARLRWRLVCRGVVVPLAWAVSRDTTLYRYLEASVLDFDGVRALQGRLHRAGFTDVHAAAVTGWQRGIVHTVLAQTPRPATSAPALAERSA
jgi:ubiquinone/menaquinone biosynthesis C-methylase UbiE